MILARGDEGLTRFFLVTFALSWGVWGLAYLRQEGVWPSGPAVSFLATLGGFGLRGASKLGSSSQGTSSTRSCSRSSTPRCTLGPEAVSSPRCCFTPRGTHRTHPHLVHGGSRAPSRAVRRDRGGGGKIPPENYGTVSSPTDGGGGGGNGTKGKGIATRGNRSPLFR